MEQAAQDDIKNHLMQTNHEFRDLVDQHCVYKRLVADLEAKPFLSEDEEVEEQRLKKLKLHLKDQIEQMMSQHKAQHA